MLKEEWVALTGHDPTPDQWDVISTVYTWHPSITDVAGKNQMKALYELGGYPLIKSLHHTAERAMELDTERRATTEEIEGQRRSIAAQIKALREASAVAHSKHRQRITAIDQELKDLEEGR